MDIKTANMWVRDGIMYHRLCARLYEYKHELQAELKTEYIDEDDTLSQDYILCCGKIEAIDKILLDRERIFEEVAKNAM